MSNFEIHQQEQNEARQISAFKIFCATMGKLNADHEAAKKRIERDTRILFLFIGIITAAMLLAPFVAILIRHFQK